MFGAQVIMSGMLPLAKVNSKRQQKTINFITIETFLIRDEKFKLSLPSKFYLFGINKV